MIMFSLLFLPALQLRTIITSTKALHAKGFGASGVNSGKNKASPFSSGKNEASPSPIIDPLDSLTHAQLSRRLSDVLKHFASLPEDHPSLQNFTPSYTPSLALLRGRLPDLLISRTRLGESSIPSAGRGLFATRNIAAAELLTLFPGDALLFREHDLAEITGVLYGKDATGDPLTSDESREFELRVSAKHSIVGDPKLDEDKAYLAHFANDGWALRGSSSEERMEYSRKSALACNAFFQLIEPECHMGLFAIRDIKVGEEVFVSYTSGYWLSRAK
jgi:hypothetical protein